MDLEEGIRFSQPEDVLEALSSKFYTLIPHSVGYKRPPLLKDLDSVQSKMDMLTVLSDIEEAQSMQKGGKVRVKLAVFRYILDMTFLNETNYTGSEFLDM